MTTNLTASASVDIDAPVSQIWDALVNPAIIKQYLFGTETKTDWKPGSPISFSGEWDGKAYEDKGKIISIEPERLMSYSYWSSFSSLSDSPENYAKVTFTLEPNNQLTRLNVTQDNCSSEAARTHSEENWQQILNKLREIVESSKP